MRQARYAKLFRRICYSIFRFKTFRFQFRRRHVVEMITMAQRPFSNVILDSTLENVSESQAQKTLTKLKPLTNKKDANVCPIAIETTSNNQAAVSVVTHSTIIVIFIFHNRYFRLNFTGLHCLCATSTANSNSFRSQATCVFWIVFDYSTENECISQ